MKEYQLDFRFWSAAIRARRAGWYRVDCIWSVRNGPNKGRFLLHMRHESGYGCGAWYDELETDGWQVHR